MPRASSWPITSTAAPACIAHSLRDICAELDIHLLHVGAGDAEAKGVIERSHRTWREEVETSLATRPCGWPT
jgi:hypothetical protein